MGTAGDRLRASFMSTPKFVIPADFEPFSAGELGNFPYYWEDPMNLRFNALTYEWIGSGLKHCARPIQLDGVFTNRFMGALLSISYGLSTTDQQKLTASQAAITESQHNLLLAWQEAFGTLPTDLAGNPPINLIMEEVVVNWANPPVTLQKILKKQDVRSVLNKVPDRAEPVLCPLRQYLTNIGKDLPLLNSVAYNNGLLRRALAALQSPVTENGALLLNNGNFVPAFTILTPVADIVEGLTTTAPSRTARLKLTLTPQAGDGVSLSINDGQNVAIEGEKLLTLSDREGGQVYTSGLPAGGQQSTISAEFTGVTTVIFGPVSFSPTTYQHWFWTDPITEALRIGQSDETGFRFAPALPSGLSVGGLSCLTGLLISNNPAITVVTNAQIAEHTANVINSGNVGDLCFIGRNISAHTPYSAMLGAEATSDGVALRLQPKSNFVPSTSSRAFVLAAKRLMVC